MVDEDEEKSVVELLSESLDDVLSGFEEEDLGGGFDFVGAGGFGVVCFAVVVFEVADGFFEVVDALVEEVDDVDCVVFEDEDVPEHRLDVPALA